MTKMLKIHFDKKTITLLISGTILIFIMINVGLTLDQASKTDRIVNATEKILEVSQEERKIGMASLESRYESFNLDFMYRIHSINPDNKYNQKITVRNDGEFDTYVKNTWNISAFCDKEGQIYGLEYNPTIQELVVKKGEWESFPVVIPEEFLEISKPSFELRLSIVSHPSTTVGFLEAKSDNKRTLLQYDYDDEAKRWRPTITQFDGGLNCSREPYSGDMRTLSTTNEEHFDYCSACR